MRSRTEVTLAAVVGWTRACCVSRYDRKVPTSMRYLHEVPVQITKVGIGGNGTDLRYSSAC